MKKYKYKIQWLFPIVANLVLTEKQLKKDFYPVLKSLKPKSFTKIIFRDDFLKIVIKYDDMHNYSDEKVLTYCKRDIEKILKNNNRIYWIELLRR